MKAKQINMSNRDSIRLREKNSVGLMSKTDNIQLTLLALPAIVLIIILRYIPMFGTILAFKDYNYSQGILGSEWVGLTNFEFFFKSKDAFVITRNTLLYNIAFIIIGQVISIAFAIMLTNMSKKAMGFFQTVLFQPFYLSWVVVAYISLIFLSYDSGLLNKMLTAVGLKAISWYDSPQYWPLILTFFRFWKTLGYDALIYYTYILAFDQSIYEAANIDGCSAFQTITRITVPMLKPTIVLLVIMAIGKIFSADFGLFYQLPRQSGALRNVTDVVETYTYRTLTSGGHIGVSSAVGLTQGVVGFVLVIIANKVAKKFDEENSIF